MSLKRDVAKGRALRLRAKRAAASWLTSTDTIAGEKRHAAFREAQNDWERWLLKNIDALMDHAESSSEDSL